MIIRLKTRRNSITKFFPKGAWGIAYLNYSNRSSFILYNIKFGNRFGYKEIRNWHPYTENSILDIIGYGDAIEYINIL